MGASCVAVFTVLLTVLRYSDTCPNKNFEATSVLETDEPGLVVLNITAEPGVTWLLELKSDRSQANNRGNLNHWLSTALVINSTTGTDVHNVELAKMLDLEYIYEAFEIKLEGVIIYNLKCTEQGGTVIPYELPLFVIAVNEYAPEFIGAPFNISVLENTPLQAVVMTLRDNATDRDVVTTGDSDIHEFDMRTIILSPTNTSLFGMDDKQNGKVEVKEQLDFESFPDPEKAQVSYLITVWDIARWNSSSTLTINILDVDDSPPEFFFPGCGPTPCDVSYVCEVSSNFTGEVTNMTARNGAVTMAYTIFARSGNSPNRKILYKIKAGPQSPRYKNFVSIDERTGVFSVTQALEAYNTAEIVFIIQAEEESFEEYPKDTTLIVKISYPPGYQTTTSPPTTQEPDTGPSATIMVAVIVLAVFVLLSFVAIGALIVYLKKRADKPIYPAEVFEEAEEEPVTDTKLQRGGSNTDSGQWSMTGVPSPGPHAGSAAPSHTRLPNGHLANGHASSPSYRKESSRGMRRTASAKSSENSSGETSGLSMRDINPLADSQAEDDPQYTALYDGMYANGSVALVHAQMHGNGHVIHRGNDVLEEEDESGDVVSPSRSGPQARRLPPLSAPPGMSGSPSKTAKRSRSSRKQRKDQALARLREEKFDGTKSYPMAVDDTFYTEGNKQKVKMSTRKKKTVLDPKYWVTVDNDYSEV